VKRDIVVNLLEGRFDILPSEISTVPARKPANENGFSDEWIAGLGNRFAIEQPAGAAKATVGPH